MVLPITLIVLIAILVTQIRVGRAENRPMQLGLAGIDVLAAIALAVAVADNELASVLSGTLVVIGLIVGTVAVHRHAHDRVGV